MKTLKEIFQDIPFLEMKGAEKRVIGLTDDSREVGPGYLFVARRGLTHDGHYFIPEALAQGAMAIVLERPCPLPEGVGLVRVSNAQAILGPLAAAFYDFPAERLTLIGITGTNGKTSTAWFIRHLLKRLGLRPGLIGTVQYDLGRRVLPAKETTPPVIRLHRYLAEMVEAGLTHVVMEVSSHALDQGRVDGLLFEVAVFTNLSRDHLDYHRDIEAYFSAKKKLFEEYLSFQGRAVVNVSDPWGRRLAEILGEQAVRVGEVGDITGAITTRSPRGYSFLLRFGDKRRELSTKLFGDFQLENLLFTVATGLALGFSFEETTEALSDLSAPPGRLELVGEIHQALVFVDYAHTPEALAKALSSLRPLVRGRLFCLFGCGGNRDKGKRPLMGQVAANLADLVIVTSDNPRYEDPGEIIKDILTGMNGASPLVISDRREAILEGLSRLGPGDVFLIAGKGHEDYQEIKGVRYPFSDQAVVREFLLTEAA